MCESILIIYYNNNDNIKITSLNQSYYYNINSIVELLKSEIFKLPILIVLILIMVSVLLKMFLIVLYSILLKILIIILIYI